MKTLTFDRKIDSLFAHADADGITLICGWTHLISRDNALAYVQRYNTDPNSGFSEHDDKVIFTHNGGKITLTFAEANALVGLIEAAYLGANAIAR